MLWFNLVIVINSTKWIFSSGCFSVNWKRPAFTFILISYYKILAVFSHWHLEIRNFTLFILNVYLYGKPSRSNIVLVWILSDSQVYTFGITDKSNIIFKLLEPTPIFFFINFGNVTTAPPVNYQKVFSTENPLPNRNIFHIIVKPFSIDTQWVIITID